MIPDWVGWLLVAFAAYRAGCVALWIARGSARTFNVFRWKRSTTTREGEPTVYWLLIIYNAVVPIPILLWVSWLILGPTTPNDALISAAGDGDKPAILAALRQKASVNAMNDRGDTPLSSAASQCDLGAVKMLIAAGADVNTKAVDTRDGLFTGWTALISASGQSEPSCPEVVRTLIAAGADVNAADAQGATALDEAANEGQLQTAQALVSAGADVNAGFPPPLAMTTPSPGMDNATGRAAVAQLLREHGAHGL